MDPTFLKNGLTFYICGIHFNDSMSLNPLRRIVRSGGKKRKRGRINVPASWINTEVIIAPERDYVVLPKCEYIREKS